MKNRGVDTITRNIIQDSKSVHIARTYPFDCSRKHRELEIKMYISELQTSIVGIRDKKREK